MSSVYQKRRFVAKWQEALAWHRHMIRLSIMGHEHRKKQEKLQAMLILANMRKVVKQERKWLKRTILNLKDLKQQRLFKEWYLEIKRRKLKR